MRRVCEGEVIASGQISSREEKKERREGEGEAGSSWSWDWCLPPPVRWCFLNLCEPAAR